jgi:hypothetical protein
MGALGATGGGYRRSVFWQGRLDRLDRVQPASSGGSAFYYVDRNTTFTSSLPVGRTDGSVGAQVDSTRAKGSQEFAVSSARPLWRISGRTQAPSNRTECPRTDIDTLTGLSINRRSKFERRLTGWILPPQVIRAFGAHCHEQTSKM